MSTLRERVLAAPFALTLVVLAVALTACSAVENTTTSTDDLGPEIAPSVIDAGAESDGQQLAAENQKEREELDSVLLYSDLATSPDAHLLSEWFPEMFPPSVERARSGTVREEGFLQFIRIESPIASMRLVETGPIREAADFLDSVSDFYLLTEGYAHCVNLDQGYSLSDSWLHSATILADTYDFDEEAATFALKLVADATPFLCREHESAFEDWLEFNADLFDSVEGQLQEATEEPTATVVTGEFSSSED